MNSGKYIALILIVILLVITIGGGLAVVAWYWGSNVTLLTGETFTAPTVTEISPSTVSLALGDTLLFKTPDGDRGAVRFNRMTSDSGADYTSWFLPGDSTLSLSQARQKNGHVFEKYWRTRDDWNWEDVEDIGGVYQVQCGPLAIGWSGATYLYMPPGYEFAVHEKNAVSQPDFDSEELQWHVAAEEEIADPFEHEGIENH